MAITTLKITETWKKVSNGEAVVLQNRGDDYIEVATVKSGDTPSAGFILNNYEMFNYPGGDEVWVRSIRNDSYIVIDNIGV